MYADLQYKCSICSHSDDLFLKLSEAVTKIARYVIEKLLKNVVRPAFKLNGSGWYETDFKKPVKKTETKSIASEDMVKTDNQKNV